MGNTHWTPTELETLREQYGKATPKDIAATVGRSIGAVYRQANALRLRNATKAHGRLPLKLYHVWAALRKRVRNAVKHAGICPMWSNSFVSFREWALSNGYREGYTLKRTNRALPFCDSNCYWKRSK